MCYKTIKTNIGDKLKFNVKTKIILYHYTVHDNNLLEHEIVLQFIKIKIKFSTNRFARQCVNNITELRKQFNSKRYY